MGGEEKCHGREWAGDPFVDGDPPTPLKPFASFTSPEGDETCLDSAGAEDGTPIGGLRDAEGEVCRYTDPAAWPSTSTTPGCSARCVRLGPAPDDVEGVHGELAGDIPRL